MQADSYMGPVIRANLLLTFALRLLRFSFVISGAYFSVQRRPPTHSGGRRCILIFGSIQEGRRKRTVCSGSSAISIRAPVGGEVSSRTSPAQSISKFQYTPLCRGRRTGLRISELCGLFQFTPKCRGRPSGPMRSPSTTYFNSRPRAGGDCRGCRSTLRYRYFSSRPCVGGDAAGFSGWDFSF